MKKLISIGFALVFLLQGGIRLFIIADYNIRKEKIAATLCINRNNPSKNCEGRCYLEKQLKKQLEQESKIPNFLKEKGEMVFIVIHHQFNIEILRPQPTWGNTFHENSSVSALESIFHPPPNSKYSILNT